MTPRIVYLATADARGHLMRAQLLVHALRQAGAHVEVLTTSAAGQSFLAGFGIASTILSRHYAVQFDTRQNMLRAATNRNVAHYMFHPARMLRDVVRLQRILRGAHLLVNDSFHPAVLFMGAMPFWRRKVVHVYGVSLRRALVANFDGNRPGLFSRLLSGLFKRVVDWQIDTARACFEHDFAYELTQADGRAHQRLPTPVALAGSLHGAAADGAAVYLNPHFRDTRLADALCAGIADAGLTAHRVGEGYARRSGWRGVDADWASRAAHAQVIVSAPGMAALSIALVYARPIVLVLTDQPEQASNAARVAQLGIAHRVVTWRGDADDFRHQVAQAVTALNAGGQSLPHVASGRIQAQARVDAWTGRLLALCSGQAAA
ncbi:MAG TPA: hypothetical protein VF663_16660 [Telluria sp.]|jgi:hypothetical protein